MSSGTSAPSNARRFTGVGLVVGAILGYPVSYYFQPGVLRAKLSLGAYIAKASEVLGDKDLRSAVILGFVVAIAVCAGVGFFAGRSMDQKR